MIDTNEIVDCIFNSGMSREKAQEYVYEVVRDMVVDTLASEGTHSLCLDNGTDRLALYFALVGPHNPPTTPKTREVLP